MSEMNYPPEELDLKGKIDNLMDEWNTYCESKPEWRGKFISDGFFPYYTKQAVRVLFIGRESYGKGGGDYIDSYNDMHTPNFHNRLLYLAYGIIHRESTEKDWIRMDNATILDQSLAAVNGFSYAFMNATKLCNADGVNTDVAKFKDFISDLQNRDFLIEEIRLINPDIIVSANLGDLGFFTYFGEEYGIIDANNSLNSKNCYIRYMTSGERKIPWIDGWHFSAPKSTFECFYEPICSIAKKLAEPQQSYILTKIFPVVNEVFSYANSCK